MLRADVAAIDVVEVAVPSLRAHRQQPLPRKHRVDPVHPTDHTRVAGTDRVGVRQDDRKVERTRFLDPRGAGHLAVAVERIPTGGAGLADAIASARQYRGDYGAHRALSGDQRPDTAD